MADTWHVTGQRQTTMIPPGGSSIMDVMEVSFLIDRGPAAGHTGRVDVPMAQYMAGEAGPLVQERVDAMTQTAGL